MVEEIVHDEPVSKGATANVRGLTGRSQPQPIGEVGGDSEDRIHLPIEEFARVGGRHRARFDCAGRRDPGIGKSTLMLQMALGMADKKRVLYVSGEESERQIKMRATRSRGRQKELPGKPFAGHRNKSRSHPQSCQ